jgi:prephenate dehydrogenase
MQEFVIREHQELCIKVSADTLEEAIEKANAISRDKWIGSHYEIFGRTYAQFQKDYRDIFGKDYDFEKLAKMRVKEANEIIQQNKRENTAEVMAAV